MRVAIIGWRCVVVPLEYCALLTHLLVYVKGFLPRNFYEFEFKIIFHISRFYWLHTRLGLHGESSIGLRHVTSHANPWVLASSDVPALAWRPKPAKASRQKPGQAGLFARLSKAYGPGFNFWKPQAMALGRGLSSRIFLQNFLLFYAM